MSLLGVANIRIGVSASVGKLLSCNEILVFKACFGVDSGEQEQYSGDKWGKVAKSGNLNVVFSWDQFNQYRCEGAFSDPETLS